MSPAQRRRRRSRGSDEATLWIVGLIIAAALAVTVLHWIAANWWVLVVVAALGTAGGGGWLYSVRAKARLRADHQQNLRLTMQGPGGLDAMHHQQFEYAIRDLLLRDGFSGARRIGGANDQAVDVLGTDPNGRVWALQCKHKDNPLHGSKVGAPVLYQLAGTAGRAYGATVPVVVTNGLFSTPAKEWGRLHGIHLVDRDVLARWAAGPWPLWNLLQRLPPPGRLP
ncbi:restriction endonuclease [Streptacidiphilus sp. EB103A]|uniref:restriction endonuclease n=1 Tax=Streptacidiphilus sp. EB103A TaxID=3156275 RepID=UPI0035162E05